MYSKCCCCFCTQLPIMQVADWIIIPQLFLYSAVFARSIYIHSSFCLHKTASLLSVFSAGTVGSVLLLPPVDITSNHVISCWLLLARVVGCQSFLCCSEAGDGALSSHHTLLICGWILPLGRRVKRITEQNEIKKNSVRVWPAIMTVSMLNASFSETSAVSWSLQWLPLLMFILTHWIPHNHNVSFIHSAFSLSSRNLRFVCMSALFFSACRIIFNYFLIVWNIILILKGIFYSNEILMSFQTLMKWLGLYVCFNCCWCVCVLLQYKSMISKPKQWPRGSRISVDLRCVRSASDSCCCAALKTLSAVRCRRESEDVLILFLM